MDLDQRNYIPYSQSPRSCYIRGKSGLSYPGVRVENISFPITISAIQAAICSCLANKDQPVALTQAYEKSKLDHFWIQMYDLDFSQSDKTPEELYKPLIDQNIETDRLLSDLCKQAVTNESDFPVSALLLTDKGYVPGVNVEFPDWNLGLCAERVAVTRALAAGLKEFKRMHIYAPKSDFCSPCGTCRQVLYEHMPDATLELHHDLDSVTRHIVSQLLPYGFTSQSLRK